MSRDLLFFLLGLVCMIPFGIATNALTPKFLDFIAKRSLSSRGKRFKTLLKEFEKIRDLQANPFLLTLMVLKDIALAMTFAVLIITLFGGFSMIQNLPSSEHPLILIPKNIDLLMTKSFGIVALIGSWAVASLLFRLTNTLTRVINYDEYKTNLRTEMEKLVDKKLDSEFVKERVSELLKDLEDTPKSKTI